ncbi:hypothetical protein ON010_g8658 [Phytophthora cinnamomi]|nr:hypothetical protein ON010_g8658 [Phytophthora cinnamomi]
MATFRIGEQVLLSTDGIRSSAVTNLGASKLAPRFIGPLRVVKVNGEAYTLDIPTSLRLHPTFYGQLKKYHPAAIPPTLDPPAPAPERRANAPLVTPGSTGAPLQAPSLPSRSAQSPPQPPPERPEHDSLQPPHPPGTPRRTPYRREPPPPIVDSAGQKCWIVDHLVAHEDPPRLGYPPDENTWEPRSSLLRDVADVVLEYESEIANESASVADHAATKIATENAIDADPVVTEITNDHAPSCRRRHNPRGLARNRSDPHSTRWYTRAYEAPAANVHQPLPRDPRARHEVVAFPKHPIPSDDHGTPRALE